MSLGDWWRRGKEQTLAEAGADLNRAVRELFNEVVKVLRIDRFVDWLARRLGEKAE
jgi:hypothetical protein